VKATLAPEYQLTVSEVSHLVTAKTMHGDLETWSATSFSFVFQVVHGVRPVPHVLASVTATN
jgi:hypothetical protein